MSDGTTNTTGDDAAAAGDGSAASRDPEQVARDAAAMLGGVSDADAPMEPVDLDPQGQFTSPQPDAPNSGDVRGTSGTGDDMRPIDVPEPITDGSAAPPEENAARSDAQPLPVAEPTAGQQQVAAFDAAMNMQAQQVQANANLTAIPEGAGFLSRAERKKAAEAKRNQGTEIYLPETGTKAIVRDLPFADHLMLQGMPLEMIRAIDATVKDQQLRAVASGQVDASSLEDALNLFGKAEQMANAYCLASFVRPRLVMTEAELDPNNPDVWLITDVEIGDRIMVLNWSNRNRALDNAASGGAVATAGFPG